jgi:hypothetical protein
MQGVTVYSVQADRDGSIDILQPDQQGADQNDIMPNFADASAQEAVTARNGGASEAGNTARTARFDWVKAQTLQEAIADLRYSNHFDAFYSKILSPNVI